MKKAASIFSVFALAIGEGFAQPLPPPPPNTAIPLDVIVSLLVLSGIIFGAIKLYRKTNVTNPA